MWSGLAEVSGGENAVVDRLVKPIPRFVAPVDLVRAEHRLVFRVNRHPFETALIVEHATNCDFVWFESHRAAKCVRRTVWHEHLTRYPRIAVGDP